MPTTHVRRMLSLLLGLGWLARPAAGQAATPAPSTSTTPIEVTEKFFDDFVQAKVPPSRNQFETADEYQARIRPKLDMNKVYYLFVDRPYGEITDNFSYDISKGLLTVYGGEDVSDEAINFAPAKTIPLCIKRGYNFSEPLTYEADNAFGATVTVHRTTSIDYVFNIINDKDFPSVVDFHNHRLAVTISADRDLAKRLSTDAKIVIGVRLRGYKESRLDRTVTKPTFDDPNAIDYTICEIDASLTEVDLVDAKDDANVRLLTISPKMK